MEREKIEQTVQFDYPHINICANVDITEFYRYIKEKEDPFYISILYIHFICCYKNCK